MPDLDLTFQQEATDQSQQEFSNPFLGGVSEEDRPIVGKYIDDWDRGVQTAFEKIHQTYAPFKGLDAEQVERALYLAEMLDNDPNYFIQAVRQELGMPDDDDNDPGEAPGVPPEWEGIPQQFIQEFQQLKEIVGSLGEGYISDKQAAQDADEMAQLDELLVEMEDVHGPFDEDWVTVKLAQGYSPEEALEAYDEFVENLVGSYRKPISVPIMGGPGGIPSGQVDTSKMGRKDTQALVAQILEASSQE